MATSQIAAGGAGFVILPRMRTTGTRMMIPNAFTTIVGGLS